jgi:hypothetical protein
MTGSSERQNHVYKFVLDKIDSVPHLEALLLLWKTRPRGWTREDLATRLYIQPDEASRLLGDLLRDELVAITPDAPDQYGYQSRGSETDGLLEDLDATYRRELVRVSTMIHSKAPPAVREFARAFRFTKEHK